MPCTVHYSTLFDYYADGSCTKINQINNFTLCIIIDRSIYVLRIVKYVHNINTMRNDPTTKTAMYCGGARIPGWKPKNYLNAAASSRYNDYYIDILRVSSSFHFGHDTVNFRTNNHPLISCSANEFLGFVRWNWLLSAVKFLVIPKYNVKGLQDMWWNTFIQNVHLVFRRHVKIVKFNDV